MVLWLVSRAAWDFQCGIGGVGGGGGLYSFSCRVPLHAYDHRPKHPYSAGAEHVVFTSTRQMLLAPIAKRREVLGESPRGRAASSQEQLVRRVFFQIDDSVNRLTFLVLPPLSRGRNAFTMWLPCGCLTIYTLLYVRGGLHLLSHYVKRGVGRGRGKEGGGMVILFIFIGFEQGLGTLVCYGQRGRDARDT